MVGVLTALVIMLGGAIIHLVSEIRDLNDRIADTEDTTHLLGKTIVAHLMGKDINIIHTRTTETE